MKDEAPRKAAFDVFLSHNSKDKPAVRALAALLIERGIRVWFDEDQLIPGQPWQPLMEEGIKKSATGAVLVGEDGVGPWEDEEMQALLRQAVKLKKAVIPVLLPGAPEEPDLPLFLLNRTWVDMRKGFTEEKLADLIWGITGKNPDSKSARKPAGGLEVAVTRLRHGAEKLVGRETELARLDAAWHDPKTHVVTIVAWGGVGKTALVVDWMARMAADGWRGAERVFDWSFYSQGTKETTAASGDVFVAKALEFFGDPEMVQSAASPWDKGERLARLIAERKTLLVLDGIEPLQYPPGPVGGKLKDPAIEALLMGLAQQNRGLCLVTTRESLTDLGPFHNTTAPEWPLERLSEEAGAQLLFDSGVRKAGNGKIKADDQELKDAAREVRGHALTLRLLGNHLKLAFGGDIRKLDLIDFEEADAQFKTTPGDAEETYGHAFKVMGACARWLGKGGEEGNRQLAVLNLLGLFDRPADAGCIGALRKEPVIEGLTEPLINLTEGQWNTTITRLAECGIVAVHRDESATGNRESVLDAHPLVREYFGGRLRKKRPEAWKEAHRRVYEHLTQSTEHRPDTLAGLQPLYQAVAHGCQAGMHEEACAEVYRDRILRGTDDARGFYSIRKLGAVGSDLAAVACFFERPWTVVSDQLSEDAQAWLLNEAAMRLLALGRLTEALGPMRAGLDIRVEHKAWKNAGTSASNLSELELTLGQVAEAVQDAERGVEYADRSRDGFMREVTRTCHADALFQVGEEGKAAELFREAELMQAECQPQYPLLYSMQGFRYCDLLLGPAERAAWQVLLNRKSETLRRTPCGGNPKVFEVCYAVEGRAGQTLGWAKGSRASLLGIAVEDLSLGRAGLYEAILAKSEIGNSKAEIEDAVAGLRRAAQVQYIPLGLLSRALVRFVEKKADGCRADLDEAWQIAERGAMRLFQADVLLHRARLFRDKAALAEARKLIEECGYHRRDGELADAEEAAKGW
jgi:tetratricopeptide (TPR) repeat protein